MGDCSDEIERFGESSEAFNSYIYIFLMLSLLSFL